MVTFTAGTQAGLWEKINAALVKPVRVKESRKPNPSAAVIDSQKVSPHARRRATES